MLKSVVKTTQPIWDNRSSCRQSNLYCTFSTISRTFTYPVFWI